MVLNGKRVLTVVSGASRGIGKEIAVQVSKRVAPNSVFLLTARNEATLLQIKQGILDSSEKAQVWIVVCDMGSFNDDAINTFKEVLEEIKETVHSTALSFHILVVAVAKERFVVNITSLVAIQGFPSLTQYSVGKAAREAFFRGLAVEDQTVKVFNYAPGPVDTAMHDVVAKQSFDEGIRAVFSQNTSLTHDAHRSCLTPTQTVEKMLKHTRVRTIPQVCAPELIILMMKSDIKYFIISVFKEIIL
ncbi:oxidoreductase, short chain dehydrogenase/reductase family protein [Cooperia oncophora]